MEVGRIYYLVHRQFDMLREKNVDLYCVEHQVVLCQCTSG